MAKLEEKVVMAEKVCQQAMEVRTNYTLEILISGQNFTIKLILYHTKLLQNFLVVCINRH